MENKKIQFSQQLEECTTSLYHLALRLTKNNADAEDLVAESVVKAWVGYDNLDESDRFRPWIFRILHNCFVSHYRKKSIRPDETSYCEMRSDEESEEDVVSLLLSQSDDFLFWWANPEQHFDKKLLNQDIFEAIDNLPETYRSTILLVNVEGFSYDDAAEILGVPTGTVRSRMKRGRTLLQKSLWHHAKEAGLITAGSLEESSP